MSLRVDTPPAATPEALDRTAMALKLGVVGQEVAVGLLIAQMTAIAEAFVNLKLWYRIYFESQLGSGSDRLYLSARPLVAVSSVTYDNGTPLVEGLEADEFELWKDQGYLYLENLWECAPGQLWRVTFSAGWWLPSMAGSPPAGVSTLAAGAPDIERAIEEMVIYQWSKDRADPTVKKVNAMKEIEVEYFAGAELPRTALDALRRRRPPVL